MEITFLVDNMFHHLSFESIIPFAMLPLKQSLLICFFFCGDREETVGFELRLVGDNQVGDWIGLEIVRFPNPLAFATSLFFSQGPAV